MASCNAAGFHTWARDKQGLTWAEAESAAFFNAYCRAHDARSRTLFWFIANNERYRDERFAETVESLSAWAADSRTKEAKRFLAAFNRES